VFIISRSVITFGGAVNELVVCLLFSADAHSALARFWKQQMVHASERKTDIKGGKKETQW